MTARDRTRTVKGTLVAVALALAGAAVAKDLPRLPEDRAIARSGDSPGVVTFRHSSHVDSDRPACLTCHPARFSILGSARAKPAAAITHDAMEKKGEACGACHGKQAFGFDECSNCHAQ